MRAIWQAILRWLRGKKTILGGSLVMAAAVAGVWYGRLEVVEGVTLFGVGLSVAGYASKVNRHQGELLAALDVVARVGEDVRAGKQVAPDLRQAATVLGSVVAGDLAQATAASLQLSAPNTSELLKAITKLTAQADPGSK